MPQAFYFESYAELLKVADKYQVDSLTETCVTKLVENLSIDNAIQGAILGFLHNNQKLKNKGIQAIVSRDKGITLNSMEGYQALRGYPDLLLEIFDFGYGPCQSGKSAKRKRMSAN